MLEKLSCYFTAEEKLLQGKSRWNLAAVAVVLLGLFASCSWAKQTSCHGAYDLYFVLDKSGSVATDWGEIHSFVKNLTERFVRQPAIESFIHRLLIQSQSPIASDWRQVRNPKFTPLYKIQEGLEHLKKVIPAGETYMHEGLKKAREQIGQQSSQSSSIILALTDGKLEIYVHELTVNEANEARKYGARVYCVGVKDFDEQQLAEIADTKDHVFPVKDGFHALKGIVDSVRTRTPSKEEMANCRCLILWRKRSWRNQAYGGQYQTVIVNPLLPLSSEEVGAIAEDMSLHPQGALVRWGEKGSTEEGARLEKAKNAKVSIPEDVEEPMIKRPTTRPNPTSRAENKWYTPIKGRLDALWALLQRQYDRVSLMRPTSADKTIVLPLRVAQVGLHPFQHGPVTRQRSLPSQTPFIQEQGSWNGIDRIVLHLLRPLTRYPRFACHSATTESTPSLD
ncbi:unnamed protein product [Menidia menidia]|uniref:(Atlantic silverside) hypothetical protein n=1 Tax=Menidia menidia TaxID=238744 RepID=A0A8S4AX95_9TELE|nr:unnamed protein product [Menidia menidia]